MTSEERRAAFPARRSRLGARRSQRGQSHGRWGQTPDRTAVNEVAEQTTAPPELGGARTGSFLAGDQPGGRAPDGLQLHGVHTSVDDLGVSRRPAHSSVPCRGVAGRGGGIVEGDSSLAVSPGSITRLPRRRPWWASTPCASCPVSRPPSWTVCWAVAFAPGSAGPGGRSCRP